MENIVFVFLSRMFRYSNLLVESAYRESYLRVIQFRGLCIDILNKTTLRIE